MSKKLKRRMIALDADPLIFECTESKFHTSRDMPDEGSSLDGSYKKSMKEFKTKFKNLMFEIENEIAAEMPGQVKGLKPFLSDPKTNFRYDLFADYKCSREAGARSKMYYRLRKWVLKKYGYHKGFEADDVVAYYVREKGWIGASIDKDLLRGVPGTWLDTYHSRRTMHETSPGEARNFNLLQTLMGDDDDDIPALPDKPLGVMIPMILEEGRKRQPYKVTEAKGIILLDEFGWTWEGVVRAYESKGLKRKNAILIRRLVGMDQWTPKGGLRLWQPPKKKKNS